MKNFVGKTCLAFLTLQNMINQLFIKNSKKRLVRDKVGLYETGLSWRRDHSPLPDNKQESLRGLENKES